MPKRYAVLLVSIVSIGFLVLNGLAGCVPVSQAEPVPISATSTIDPEMTNTASGLPTPSKTVTSTPVASTSSISGWVAYSGIVHREPLVTQIFLKNLDTGKVRQLTNSGNNDQPKWSPDGSKIMFLSWTKDNSFDIYLISKDGTDQRPVVATSANELIGDWSPDGKKIVFASNQDGDDQIYMIDLGTQVVSKLTNIQGFATLPSWSSDGKRIAFEAANVGNAGRSQIFIMNADGTDIQQITQYDIDTFDGAPFWCPDNSCIIFERYVNGLLRLMSVDLKSKQVTPLLDNVFDPKYDQAKLENSSSRHYLTFSVGEKFYAMDMITKEVFPLGVDAFDLSLYP